MRQIALIEHFALRAVWSLLPAGARRAVTGFRQSRWQPYFKSENK